MSRIIIITYHTGRANQVLFTCAEHIYLYRYTYIYIYIKISIVLPLLLSPSWALASGRAPFLSTTVTSAEAARSTSTGSKEPCDATAARDDTCLSFTN